MCMKGYFRALAAMCAQEATAQMFAGLSTLAVVLYAGEWRISIIRYLGVGTDLSWCRIYDSPPNNDRRAKMDKLS